MKAKDLPIYTDTANSDKVQLVEKKVLLQDQIVPVRQFLVEFNEKYSHYTKRIQSIFETSRSHTQGSFEMLQNNPDILFRVGLISLFGLGGVVLGHRAGQLFASSAFTSRSSPIAFPRANCKILDKLTIESCAYALPTSDTYTPHYVGFTGVRPPHQLPPPPPPQQQPPPPPASSVVAARDYLFYQARYESSSSSSPPSVAISSSHPCQPTSWGVNNNDAASSSGASCSQSPLALIPVSALTRRILLLLNKFSPDNFEKLTLDLLNVGLDSACVLRSLVHLIFRKALDELQFTSLYAQLCLRLCKDAPNFESTTATDVSTFRLLLLDECSEEFSSRVKYFVDLPTVLSSHCHVDQHVDIADKCELARMRARGSIRFLCELADVGVLTDRHIHTYLKDLLSKKRDRRVALREVLRAVSKNLLSSGEELTSWANTMRHSTEVHFVVPATVQMIADVESSCQLLIQLGKRLDQGKASQWMDQYMSRLNVLKIRRVPTDDDSDSAAAFMLPSRIRFMVEDVEALRAQHWLAMHTGQKSNGHDGALMSRRQMRLKWEEKRIMDDFIRVGLKPARNKHNNGGGSNNVHNNNENNSGHGNGNSNNNNSHHHHQQHLSNNNAMLHSDGRMENDHHDKRPYHQQQQQQQQQAQRLFLSNSDSGWDELLHLSQYYVSRSNEATSNLDLFSRLQQHSTSGAPGGGQRNHHYHNGGGGSKFTTGSPLQPRPTTNTNNANSNNTNHAARMPRPTGTVAGGSSFSGNGNANNNSATTTDAWAAFHCSKRRLDNATGNGPTTHAQHHHQQQQATLSAGNHDEDSFVPHYNKPNGHKTVDVFDHNSRGAVNVTGVQFAQAPQLLVNRVNSTSNTNSGENKAANHQHLNLLQEVDDLLKDNANLSEALSNKSMSRLTPQNVCALLTRFMEHCKSDDLQQAPRLSRCADIVQHCRQRDLLTKDNLLLGLQEFLSSQLTFMESSGYPLLKSRLARFLCLLIVRAGEEAVIASSLEELTRPMHNGQYFPLFLLLLQNLSSWSPEEGGVVAHQPLSAQPQQQDLQLWLGHIFDLSQINMGDMLPTFYRSDDNMLQLLTDRQLLFLQPHLTVRKQLDEALSLFLAPTRDKDNNMLPQVKTIYHNFQCHDANKKQVLFSSTLMRQCLQLVHDASNTECELWNALAPILSPFIHCSVVCQKEALYALQVFWHERGSPKNFFLQSCVKLNELGLIDPKVFVIWKSDFKPAIPGKGAALFEVNKWIGGLMNSPESG